MKLPSILLPSGLVLGPTYIRPAHPVGNVYCVEGASARGAAGRLPTADGDPIFEPKERDKLAFYEFAMEIVMKSRATASSVLGASVVSAVFDCCV